MLLAELVRASAAVAVTRSRKKKRATLAELLRSLSPEEVPVGVPYLSGALPQGRIGVGWAAIRDLDGGEPAAEASLELLDVHARLSALAAEKGAGSQARRRAQLTSLFERATAPERDFLARLLLGELRQGALTLSMVDAVADATQVDAATIRRAAMFAGSVADVATLAMLEGEAALERFELTLFRPVLPMLASPAPDFAEALAQLGGAVLDVKLDGGRVQVHRRGDEVRVYTRRLHEITDRVPEIVEAVRGFSADSLILDGEALVVRPDGTPRSFQTTMRRLGRRRGVAKKRAELPLSHHYFDVLFADGEALIDRPLRDRLVTLDRVVPKPHRVERRLTDDPEEAEAFFEEVLARGHEGVMAKSLEGPYEAGKRGASWMKLKPAHTLDLAVLAVERGSGRRRGWLSNLHLGARGDDGQFVMLGKTFKGLSDEMLQWQTEHLGRLRTREDGHVLHVRPELVVEIAFSDVQESPHYPGGMALRFARVKHHRPDKPASDAATVDEVRAILKHGHRRRGAAQD